SLKPQASSPCNWFCVAGQQKETPTVLTSCTADWGTDLVLPKHLGSFTGDMCQDSSNYLKVIALRQNLPNEIISVT
ncbi:Hypothetical predicted protein, partial [Marmota monax]